MDGSARLAEAVLSADLDGGKVPANATVPLIVYHTAQKINLLRPEEASWQKSRHIYVVARAARILNPVIAITNPILVLTVLLSGS